MAWRRKMMPVSEWAPFQNLFEELFIRTGAPEDLALFVQHEAGSDVEAIYMTGNNLGLVENFSPGGWEDSDAPSGEGVSFLVGHSGDIERFGVKFTDI